jgi:hypothetical protein
MCCQVAAIRQPDEHHGIYPCSVAPSFVLRGCLGKNNALGQAHSPAIELRLKIAPLAGLFRPTVRRVFSEKEVTPLGCETPLRVDVRFICASH